jgi:HAD superfamily hydrolase (TIGR01662 family)
VKVAGIIFDLGDTLMYLDGDPEDIVSQGVAEMVAFFKRKRANLDEVALGQVFLSERQASRSLAYRTQREVTCGASLRASLDKIVAPPDAYGLLDEVVRVYFGPEEAAWKAFPDARATLKHLSGRGYRLGLLSNATDDAFVQRLVNRLGLRPWLSPVFSSAGLDWRKPRREPFDLILSRWNLPSQSVVMVGDTPYADIQGAHNAGLGAILVSNGKSPPNNQGGEKIAPDAGIAALSELPSLVATW